MNEPKKPLPKPAQYAILVAAIGLIGAIFWLVRPGKGPCTTTTFGKQMEGATCLLEGTVEDVNEDNKRLNAVALGATALDQFVLVDGAGRAPVFFDPNRVKAPTAGAHVKITATIHRQRENTAPRLLATRIE